jgi:hypothetical protein
MIRRPKRVKEFKVYHPTSELLSSLPQPVY